MPICTGNWAAYIRADEILKQPSMLCNVPWMAARRKYPAWHAMAARLVMMALPSLPFRFHREAPCIILIMGQCWRLSRPKNPANCEAAVRVLTLLIQTYNTDQIIVRNASDGLSICANVMAAQTKTPMPVTAPASSVTVTPTPIYHAAPVEHEWALTRRGEYQSFVRPPSTLLTFIQKSCIITISTQHARVLNSM